MVTLMGIRSRLEKLILELYPERGPHVVQRALKEISTHEELKATYGTDDASMEEIQYRLEMASEIRRDTVSRVVNSVNGGLGDDLASRLTPAMTDMNISSEYQSVILAAIVHSISRAHEGGYVSKARFARHFHTRLSIRVTSAKPEDLVIDTERLS